MALVNQEGALLVPVCIALAILAIAWPADMSSGLLSIALEELEPVASVVRWAAGKGPLPLPGEDLPLPFPWGQKRLK